MLKLKYLNIDNYSKYGNRYVVRCKVNTKNFIVWKGNDLEIGKIIALELQNILTQGTARFLEWYDYEREEFIRGVCDERQSKDAKV